MKRKDCDNCNNIHTYKNFKNPSEFLTCVEEIAKMVERNYELISGKLKVQDDNGCWVDDSIFINIRCKICGAEYRCYADTYHGHGYFKRNK